jgi:cytoskeletal protein CcmA (bactofilin family)
MFQSKKINNSISSILGPELKIDGDIKSKGDLLIYGEVAGNVISDGTINSAKGSVVQGNINAKNASIHGTVKGDLTIQHKVILGKESHLEGNLKAAIITIEEGAKFDGMCHMIQENQQDKKIQSIHDANFSAKNETA